MDLHNMMDTLMIGYNNDEIDKLFPNRMNDVFNQQVDLRTENSWMLEADQIDLKELAEVYMMELSLVHFGLLAILLHILILDPVHIQ